MTIEKIPHLPAARAPTLGMTPETIRQIPSIRSRFV